MFLGFRILMHWMWIHFLLIVNIICIVFSPISLMARCLQKIKVDGADALVITPLWPTQIWFTPLMDMLIDPSELQNSPDTTRTVGTTSNVSETKINSMSLMRKSLKVNKFHQKLQTPSYSHGECQLKNSIRFIFENGFRSVTKGKLIEFIHL